MRKKIYYLLVVLSSLFLSLFSVNYVYADEEEAFQCDATITFDANGGVYSDGSIKKTDNQSINVLFDTDNVYFIWTIDLNNVESPSKTGYKFVGWANNKYSSVGEKISYRYCDYDETLTSFTLYAIYEVDTSFIPFTAPSGYEDTGEGLNSFLVNFYSNGGTYIDGSDKKTEYQSINWYVDYSGFSFIYPINLQSVETPARTGYKFVGWSDSTSSDDSELYWFSLYGGQADYSYYNLYAQWESESTKGLIRFLNYDGTVLQSEELESGTLPEYKGTTPTKPDEGEYVYTFSGWDKVISEVNGDCDYIAQFTKTLKTYKILISFETKTSTDFIIAKNGEYVARSLSTYINSTNPYIITQDELMSKFNELLSKNCYELKWERSGVHLSGWSIVDQGEIEESYSFDLSETSSITFYSVEDYDDITIRFLNYDGTVLESKVVKAYSSFAYTGATPTKPSTAEGKYVFSGWSPNKTSSSQSCDLTAQYEFVKNQYTIRFLNHDGSVLETKTLSYGDTPVYSGTTPTKPSTAEYSYTFKGWDQEITIVSSDIDYIATFTEIKNKYLIRFLNDDGTILQSSEVEYGKTPVFTGSTPTKEGNAEWSYTFKGWDKGLASVTSASDYTATYTKTVNKYLIRFLNDDGTVLQTSEVEYGLTPKYTGSTPTKNPTVELQYTFKGWDKSIENVEANIDYTATYSSSVRIYTIRFYNYDGTLLNTQKFEYGTAWTDDLYKGPTPTRDAEEHYTYDFKGWDDYVYSVWYLNSDIDLTAQFTEIPNKYYVYWWAGGLLGKVYFDYGSMPYYCCDYAYESLSSILDYSDEQYDYHFIGFTPEYHIVEGEQEYNAVFSKSIHTYTIKFVDYDGTVLQEDTLNYGTTPTYNGDIPVRDQTAEYQYTFSGWDKSISIATEDTVYTAVYSSIKRKYNVVFLNYDNTQLQASVYEYGVIPSYTGDTPIKEDDGEIIYTFSGWDKKIVAVTEDTTYIAQFNSEKKKYPLKITFDLNGGYYWKNNSETYGSEIYDSVIKEYEDTDTFTFTQEALNKIFVTIGQYPDSLPEKENFKFIGWSLSRNASTIDNKITFEENEVIIYANYKQLYWLEVGFYKNGGILKDNGKESNSQGIIIDYSCEEKFSSLSQDILNDIFYHYGNSIYYYSLTREGYCFLGWSTSKNATTVDETISCKCYTSLQTDKELELYAVWVEGDYQLLVNLDANGGFFKGNEISYLTIDYGYLKDSKISFTSETITDALLNVTLGNSSLSDRDGYAFIGWSDSPTGKVKNLYEYTPEEPLTELTFYAIWKKSPSISITFKNENKIYYFDKIVNQWDISEIVNMKAFYSGLEVLGTWKAENLTEGARAENEYYIGGVNKVRITFNPTNADEYATVTRDIEFTMYISENIVIYYNLYLKIADEKTVLNKTLTSSAKPKTVFSHDYLTKYLEKNNLDLIVYSCSKSYGSEILGDDKGVENIDIIFTYNTKFIYNFNMGTDGESDEMIQDISDSWQIKYLDNGKIMYYPSKKPTAERKNYNFLGWYYMDGDTESQFSANFISLSNPVEVIYLVAKWERNISDETTEEFKKIMNATYTQKNSSASSNNDWQSLIDKLSVGGKVEIVFENEYTTYIFKEKGSKVVEKIRFENDLSFLNEKTIEDAFYIIETIDEEKTLMIEYLLSDNEYILYYPQSGIYLSKNYITLYSRDFAFIDGDDNIRSYYLYFNSDIDVDHFTMMKFNYKYTWNKEVVESQHTIFDSSSDLIFISSKADNRLQTLKKALEDNAIQNFEEDDYSVNGSKYKYRMRFLQQQTYSTGEIIISWIPLVNSIFSSGCDDTLYITTDLNNPITMNYLDPLEVSYILDGIELTNVKAYDKVNIGTDEPGGNTGEPTDLTPKVNPFDFVSFFKALVEVFNDFSLLALIKVLLKYYGCTGVIIAVIVFFPFVKSILSIVISMFTWIFGAIFSIFKRE